MTERSEIFKALSQVMDPEMQTDVVSLDFISEVEVVDGTVKIHFQPDTIACPILDTLIAEIKSVVLQLEGVRQVEVVVDDSGHVKRIDRGELPAGGIGHLNRINKVISVMSGKCRAKKCMVSSFLAIYLRRAGYQVGLLDTDISDRNICKMFFPQKPSPKFTPRAMLPAITSSGIKMMALSVHLPDEKGEMNYHSPAVITKIRELNTEVFWGNLDYLIVDMPSGTSELPREILQSYSENGVILVTTPHDLDGAVIKKVANEVERAGVRILGLVENLSNFDVGIDEFADVVMSPGHFSATAQALHLPELGRLKIESSVAVQCDSGKIEGCQVPDFEGIAKWVQENA